MNLPNKILAIRALESREARVAFPMIQKYSGLINRQRCCSNDKTQTLQFKAFLAYLENLTPENKEKLKKILGIEVQNT